MNRRRLIQRGIAVISGLAFGSRAKADNPNKEDTLESLAEEFGWKLLGGLIESPQQVWQEIVRPGYVPGCWKSAIIWSIWASRLPLREQFVIANAEFAAHEKQWSGMEPQ